MNQLIPVHLEGPSVLSDIVPEGSAWPVFQPRPYRGGRLTSVLSDPVKESQDFLRCFVLFCQS